MNLILRLFLVFLIIGLMVLLIRVVKKKKMSNNYTVKWFLILIVMFLFVLFPEILMFVSDILGFEATSNMLFLLGYFFFFYLIFNQSLEISKQKKEIVSLVLELSILKKKLEDKE